MNIFDVLMVLALGSLSGTGIGLIIGSIARKQVQIASKAEWNEVTISLVSVVLCICFCTAGMAWIFLK